MSADDGRNIEEIAADNAQLRSDLRNAQKEAAKNSALQGEIDRLNQNGEKLKGKILAAQEDLRDRDARISELESDLREKAKIEQECQDAQYKANEAIEERDNAQAELAEAKSHLEQRDFDLNNAHNEIKRLKQHEEHTQVYKRLNDLTQEIT